MGAAVTEHHYLSTAFLHEAEALAAGDTVRAAELHAYCAGETGVVGAKIPARCKFCPAVCECPAHIEDGGTQVSASIQRLAAELAPARGSGCTEAPGAISEPIHCIAFDRDQDSALPRCTCGHSDDDHDGDLGPCLAPDYPLQETYPGSGIYE